MHRTLFYITGECLENLKDANIARFIHCKYSLPFLHYLLPLIVVRMAQEVWEINCLGSEFEAIAIRAPTCLAFSLTAEIAIGKVMQCLHNLSEIVVRCICTKSKVAL